MLNERLLNEHSFQAGLKVLHIVGVLLREEDRGDVLHEVCEVVRDAIVNYQTAIEHREKRLKPLEKRHETDA